MGAPGDPWWRDAAGPIDLSRDVPGFEVLEEDQRISETATAWALGTPQVVVCLADTAPLPETPRSVARSAGPCLLLMTRG